MKALFNLLFIIVFSLSDQLNGQNAEDDVVGLWYNEEKTGKIEIFEKDDRFFGKITWVKLEAGDNGLDNENPDPNLRTQPLVGLLILKNFEYDDGGYENGTIYDPENGKTYSCVMKLENPDKLYVRGYIGISLIGRTTYWTRIK